MGEENRTILFQKNTVEYADTSYFGKLILDYLGEKEELKPFYNGFPSLKEFELRMQGRSSFPDSQRKVLHEVLQDQYKGLEISSKSSDSMHKLLSSNSFTVATGHQLCLFTGPLYFLYKIAGIIRQAEELNKVFPASHIVPVFWMATEDHDFEEVNHAHIQASTVQWETESGAAVGKLLLKDVQKSIQDLSNLIGIGDRQNELIQLFKRCYKSSNTLAQATRALVNELFGEYGLLIVDGDDARLKRSMIPVFRSELETNTGFKAIEKQSEKLSAQYSSQAYPREINLFYLTSNGRFRLEKNGDSFVALGSDFVFTPKEIFDELEHFPERFSPNVLLRPLYQETILPNLAYTGGGGELAYWFQLKELFDQFETPFPLLLLRNSFLWIQKSAAKKRQKAKLHIEELFKSSNELIENKIKEDSNFDFRLSQYVERLELIFDELGELSLETDMSMQTAVAAQRQKQMKGLDNLKKKLLRAEKRKANDLVSRIECLEKALFPKGQLQERYANWVDFYLAYGSEFIEVLIENSDFLNFKFSVLEEQ